MEPGVAILLLLIGMGFGWQVVRSLAVGGFRIPRIGLVTREGDPVTFWLVILGYGAFAALLAVGGLAALVFSGHWISN